MILTSFTRISSNAVHITVAAVGLAGAIAVIGSGCTAEEWGGGGEGDRCNAALSHDECGDGLQCTQPQFCPETYCCPTSGVSGNTFCQTGCNGGAASICNADQDPDACAFVAALADAGTTPGTGD